MRIQHEETVTEWKCNPGEYIVYGAGKAGRQALGLLHSAGVSVAAICDATKCGEIDSISILPPEDCLERFPDAIYLVTPQNDMANIILKLRKEGVPQHRIFCYDYSNDRIFPLIGKELFFSVIIPVYNAEKYIAATIQSVLDQVCGEFEMIIIDDFSTDSSAEILSRFSDSRMKRITHKENMGVSVSRNEGLEIAKGEYIIFLDHDDLLPEDRLLRHMIYLEKHPEIGAVGGKIINIDGQGELIDVYRDQIEADPLRNRAVLHSENPYINSSVTYRKSVLEDYKIRFWDKAYGLEDYVFLLAVSKVSRVSAIEDVTLQYRRHETNTEKKILSQHMAERTERYKDVYEFSFRADGVKLGESDIQNLIHVFATETGRKITFEDCVNLFHTFNVIADQLSSLEDESRESLVIWIRENLEKYAEKMKWLIP